MSAAEVQTESLGARCESYRYRPTFAERGIKFTARVETSEPELSSRFSFRLTAEDETAVGRDKEADTGVVATSTVAFPPRRMSRLASRLPRTAATAKAPIRPFSPTTKYL